MLKSPKINQIAIDKPTNLWYNLDIEVKKEGVKNEFQIKQKPEASSGKCCEKFA